MSCSSCEQINCFIPPPLQPGPTTDSQWCVCCNSGCGKRHRRYASRQYIEINANVKKTFLRLLANTSNSAQVDPGRLNAYIEIRLLGCETLIACYNPFQRTKDGYLGFYWDEQFTDACPGLYVGDMYVDCNYCFSVKFRIRPCAMVVDSFYNEETAETCGLGDCQLLPTVGIGGVGGLECPEAPSASECGLPPPYFETTDPAVPEEATQTCNLNCAPVACVVGDDIVGNI